MYTALIVDGEKIERFFIQQILSTKFKQIDMVFEANSNEEAISVLNTRKIDLIILNITHSIVLSMKLTNLAKTVNPNIVIIITTIKSECEAVYGIIKLNLNGYLLKPFSPAQLEEIINKHLCKANEKNNYIVIDNKIISQIKDNLNMHLYREAVEAAKEYINSIFETYTNSYEIAGKIKDFIEQLTSTMVKNENATINKLIHRINRIESSGGLKSARFDLNEAIRDIFSEIFKIIDRNYTYSNDILKAINYIEQNIKADITLESVAKYLNMSPCYFSKFFKKTVGINFTTYVTDRKIELAKEMLSFTNMPILNIAYELSYNETNYFSKVFKKRVGVTPSDFRAVGA